MSNLVDDLRRFLDQSPTPYHAVANAKAQLLAHGYQELQESEAWNIAPSGRYFLQRRDASIIAIKMGEANPMQSGLRIIGAHTDSPTLKIKPRPDLQNCSYGQLGVEVYGGVLLNPWFDRDLSIAGRVACRYGDEIRQVLVNFERPVASIPSLAIHLDRAANAGKEINPQTHMRPILWQGADERDFRALLAEQIGKKDSPIQPDDILGHDLSFYDVQPSATVGIDSDFLASARLDNLLSSFLGLRALLECEPKAPAIVALYDHEEVGSTSDIGANSNMLPSLIERLFPEVETRHRVVANSCLFSVDNAHGIHPNFAHKHDENHAPKLNGGPVIKVDAGQSYATSSETAALVQWLAQSVGAPVQHYVTRADLRCGSTIGPMSAAKTGIRTVDLGLATLAMHSIREFGGAKDVVHMHAILKAFLNTQTLGI